MIEPLRLDLHTHSIISYDGGITLEEYRELLSQNICIAVTDHNEVSFAQKLHEEMGEKVIVGEEIMTAEGEIIGLFLRQLVRPYLTAWETVKIIKQQGGLVYIPHPFEVSRKGLKFSTLKEIAPMIDIVEVFNGRSLEPWKSKKADQFAGNFRVAKASSSDAHGIKGIGTAYSIVDEVPTAATLVQLLKPAHLEKHRASFISFFYPLWNKLKKKFNHAR